MGACQQKNFGFEIKAKTVQIGTRGPIEHSASTQQANGRWCWLDRLSRANLPLPSAEQSKSVCASICVCCLLSCSVACASIRGNSSQAAASCPIIALAPSNYIPTLSPRPHHHHPPSPSHLILIILLLTLSVPPPIPPNSPSFPPQHD